MFLAAPRRKRLSITTTSSPRLSARATALHPMKPAPPVIRTFTSATVTRWFRG